MRPTSPPLKFWPMLRFACLPAFALVLALRPAVAQVGETATSPAEAYTGCYSVSVETWPDSLQHITSAPDIPAWVKLSPDSSPHFSPEEGRMLESPGTGDLGPFRYWIPLRDGILLSRYLHPVAMSIRVHERPDSIGTFTGHLVVVTDAIRPGRPSRGSVRARMTRRTCPES